MPRQPRQPSDAEKEKYGLEALIERKVALMHMAETEYDILRREHEASKKGSEESEMSLDDSEDEEDDFPYDPELRKKFLEKCEKIIEQPATTSAE